MAAGTAPSAPRGKAMAETVRAHLKESTLNTGLQLFFSFASDLWVDLSARLKIRTFYMTRSQQKSDQLQGIAGDLWVRAVEI